jgi:alpha-tubulin suppressor-like RCC1 family protein
VAWGDRCCGQTVVPAGLSGVTAIAAGDYSSLALKADGTVVAWGENRYGQTDVPAVNRIFEPRPRRTVLEKSRSAVRLL